MVPVTVRSPEQIVGRLLYRDADLLVLDKPAGIAVHAAPSRPQPGRARPETITDWLDHLRFGLPRRPELAHRLDRETSGCLVLGRHRTALARLADLFRSGGVEKTYWAIVEGGPAGEEGLIDRKLGRVSADPKDWRMRVDEESGDPATTRWRVLGRAEGRAFLALSPETGRTHQLRVHCASMGWPIAGDRLYGEAGGPLMLHARSVAFPWRRNKPPVRVESTPPEAFGYALADFGRVSPAVSPPEAPAPSGP